MVQQTCAVPRSRSVHRARARLAVRVRRCALHLLPRHRPDLPPDGPGHHEGRAILSRRPAPRLHAPVVPGAHAAHGAAGGGAPGRWPSGERPRGRRLQGRRGERAPAVPPGPGGLPAHHAGHRRPHARPESRGERRVPAPALPHPPGAGGERPAGAHIQRHVRRPDDLRRGRQRLPGRAAGPPRLRRARRQALADHQRPRGPPAHRRGEPAHHAPPDERRRERGRHPAGQPAEDDRGRSGADGRGGRRVPVSLHALRHLRHEPVGGFAAEERAARREAREGSRPPRARREDRRVSERSAKPRAVPDRAPQALRAAAGRARLRARRLSTGDPLPPRRPEHRARRQPGDPGDLLSGDDIARGRRAARADPAGHRDLDAERAVRRRRPRAPRRDGVGVAVARDVVVDRRKTLDKYLRVKPPLMYILEHFAYRLPAALHDGLPVVMLVATIFLFLTLSRYHELTALKAAGVSLYRVSAPILGLSLLVAIGSGLFQELALPVLNERGDEVDRVKIRGQAPRHLQSRQRLWVRSGDSRFYRVELLHPGTNDMYGVTILELDREFRLVGRLDARRAHWTPAGWELSEGAYREIGADNKVQTVPFGWTALDLREEMDDFIRIQKSVSAMSFWELKDYINQLEAAGFQIRKYLVELYSKLSFPLVNLVMVLVAIPFALQSPRGGRLFGIGLAIAIM